MPVVFCCGGELLVQGFSRTRAGTTIDLWKTLADSGKLHRLLANLYNGNVYIWSTNDQVGTAAIDRVCE